MWKKTNIVFDPTAQQTTDESNLVMLQTTAVLKGGTSYDEKYDVFFKLLKTCAEFMGTDHSIDIEKAHVIPNKDKSVLEKYTEVTCRNSALLLKSIAIANLSIVVQEENFLLNLQFFYEMTSKQCMDILRYEKLELKNINEIAEKNSQKILKLALNNALGDRLLTFSQNSKLLMLEISKLGVQFVNDQCTFDKTIKSLRDCKNALDVFIKQNESPDFFVEKSKDEFSNLIELRKQLKDIYLQRESALEKMSNEPTKLGFVLKDLRDQENTITMQLEKFKPAEITDSISITEVSKQNEIFLEKLRSIRQQINDLIEEGTILSIETIQLKQNCILAAKKDVQNKIEDLRKVSVESIEAKIADLLLKRKNVFESKKRSLKGSQETLKSLINELQSSMTYKTLLEKTNIESCLNAMNQTLMKRKLIFDANRIISLDDQLNEYKNELKTLIVD